MPTVERIETWRGQDVLDGAGDKAGRLDEVYYDSAAQEPVLLAVKHGRLGRQVTLVPAAEAVLSHTISGFRTAPSKSNTPRAARSRTS